MTLPPADPDLPFEPEMREGLRLRALGLARPVLLEVLAGVHVDARPTVRALAAAALVGDVAGTLAYRTAAWVHAGGAEPEIIEVATPVGAHRAGPATARLRQLHLPPADITDIGGVPVTTPERTAADLARDLAPGPAATWLDRLREHAGVEPEDVIHQLDMMPTARRVAPARRLVRTWAATPAPSCSA